MRLVIVGEQNHDSIHTIGSRTNVDRRLIASDLTAARRPCDIAALAGRSGASQRRQRPGCKTLRPLFVLAVRRPTALERNRPETTRMSITRRADVRNLSIIAHVDHGKTTLVDGLLHACRAFRENQQVAERMMDSDAQERERGITIYAKNVALDYNGIRLNVIDTPGHADFGGEVERILGMCDGAVLVVDAYEGPMPQTRFVLQKAFLHGLKVLVVVNKIDRPDARPQDVLNEVFDLFCELEANDEQLDFPVVYCSARDRFASTEPTGERVGLELLLDRIIEHIPGPIIQADEPFSCQVTKISYDNYLGKIAVGRVKSGELRAGQSVAVAHPEKKSKTGPIKGLFV